MQGPRKKVLALQLLTWFCFTILANSASDAEIRIAESGCVECDEANEEECDRNGVFTRCQSENSVCEVSLTVNSSVGGITYTRRCAPIADCLERALPFRGLTMSDCAALPGLTECNWCEGIGDGDPETHGNGRLRRSADPESSSGEEPNPKCVANKPSTGAVCVTDCKGRPDGTYQSCHGCNVYVICDGGVLSDNHPCPGDTVWSDNVKSCGVTTSTCSTTCAGKCRRTDIAYHISQFLTEYFVAKFQTFQFTAVCKNRATLNDRVKILVRQCDTGSSVRFLRWTQSAIDIVKTDCITAKLPPNPAGSLKCGLYKSMWCATQFLVKLRWLMAAQKPDVALLCGSYQESLMCISRTTSVSICPDIYNFRKAVYVLAFRKYVATVCVNPKPCNSAAFSCVATQLEDTLRAEVDFEQNKAVCSLTPITTACVKKEMITCPAWHMTRMAATEKWVVAFTRRVCAEIQPRKEYLDARCRISQAMSCMRKFSFKLIHESNTKKPRLQNLCMDYAESMRCTRKTLVACPGYVMKQFESMNMQFRAILGDRCGLRLHCRLCQDVSQERCAQSDDVVTCPANGQYVCYTKVSNDDGEILIRKGCKIQNACASKERKNGEECKEKKVNDQCFECCNKDMCNTVTRPPYTRTPKCRKWGQWTRWSKCSKTCGKGLRKRIRKCLDNAVEPTTSRPTLRPTPKRTPRPTRRPTPRPTRKPTARPTRRPTPRPTRRPTARPTRRPTPRPTRRPTARPTPKPKTKKKKVPTATLR